jgi:hypothetical protein
MFASQFENLTFVREGVLPPWFVIIFYALITPSTVIKLSLYIYIFYECKLSYYTLLPLILSSDVM